MTYFMNNHRGDYQDMMKEFEITKRNIEFDTEKHIKIKIPFNLFETVKMPRFKGKEFKEALADSRYAHDIKLIGDKIKLNDKVAKSLIEQVAENIMKYMEECFRDVITQHNLSLILMVGGFSESPYIQQCIRERFEGQNNVKCLIPCEAGLAVLKGAVIFGRQPESITSRQVHNSEYLYTRVSNGYQGPQIMGGGGYYKFIFFSTKTYVVGTQMKCLNETGLSSDTTNI